MKDVHFYAIIAGIFFGVWPLLMNRSGLEGFASATIFAGVVFLITVPVAIWSGQIQQVNLSSPLIFGISAGVCGALGVLAFNTMLAKVTVKDVGLVFILMIMIQLSTPVIYHMVQSGDVSPRKIAGVIGAFVVAYLLA